MAKVDLSISFDSAAFLVPLCNDRSRCARSLPRNAKVAP